MRTKLLTPNEVQRIENLGSPGSVIKVACIARLYMVLSRRWVKAASGVVTLEEHQDSSATEICFYDWNVSF